MQTTTETTEESHSLQNAKAAFANIKKMLRACDRETAAEDYAATLSREKCIALLDGRYVSDEIDALRDAVADDLKDQTINNDDAGFEFDEEEARQRIQEDALEVSVKTDWHSPGETDVKATEFYILLTTGGPALRIRGELDHHLQPSRAWMEHQDWGTPWTEWCTGEQEILVQYASHFYFGE